MVLLYLQVMDQRRRPSQWALLQNTCHSRTADPEQRLSEGKQEGLPWTRPSDVFDGLRRQGAWKQPQRIRGTQVDTWLQGNISPWQDHRKYILASAPNSWHRGPEILVISLVIEVSFALMRWLLVGSWNAPNMRASYQKDEAVNTSLECPAPLPFSWEREGL